MDEFLVIDHVSKTFGALRAVDQVSLSVSQGESFSLLGPSGCGKTTLLRMLAGFERPDSGRILLAGQDITALPPERRPVNTVFQNYALFPHLNVWENIAFGLRMSRRSGKEIHKEVERMLELVRLEDQAPKRPAQLSGGQRQRVAIARALVNRPQVLLLDEPLAALDLKLRQHMLMELNTIHEQVGTTFIYVTHDQGEAMSLSDRIAVMNAGRVEQIDSPGHLYERPRSSFVASFIGDANFFTGKAAGQPQEGRVRVRIEGLDSVLVLSDGVVVPNQSLRLMVRPEKIGLSLQPPAGGDGLNALAGVVERIDYFGSHTRYRIRAGEHQVTAQLQSSRLNGGGAEMRRGEKVWMSFRSDECRVVMPEVDN